MAEHLEIAQGNKNTKYDTLYKQIAALTENEPDTIARMANMCAMIHATFDFWWTGFYRVIDNVLVLAPFQGPLACTRIAYGKGVCGTAWKERTSQVVADVEQFPGHIACSSASKSEIVIPIIDQEKQVIGVLDIDSQYLGTFDECDRQWLEKIVALLVK